MHQSQDHNILILIFLKKGEREWQKLENVKQEQLEKIRNQKMYYSIAKPVTFFLKKKD